MLKRAPLRSSLLRQAILNPELCNEMIHNAYEIDQTPAMAFGSLAHLVILEPDKFENMIELKEPKKGKEFDLNKEGKYLVNPNTKQKLLDMQRILYHKKNIKSLINGTIEGEFLAQIDSLDCVARPDIYYKDTIIDYKTVSNIKRNWTYASIDAGYNIQFAHYHRVLETLGYTPKKWVHIVQSTTFPFNTQIYKFSNNYMQHAFKTWEDAIKIYKLILSNEYPFDLSKEEVVDIRHYDMAEEQEDDVIFGGV